MKGLIERLDRRFHLQNHLCAKVWAAVKVCLVPVVTQNFAMNDTFLKLD